MKNCILILLILLLSVSCKKDLVKQPARLIERGKMIDIMYDLSLLDAMKYQSPATIDSINTDPTKFILKKYKVDSLQFAESNKYYATDYENYKDMFDEIGKRLAVTQRATDSIVKIEEKKAAKEAKKKAKDTLKDGAKKTLKPLSVEPVQKEKPLDQ
ncbi:DUF4296 domain-containing protein [Flavobacterium chilense]|uniref:DUF4296 domain-containing protein n=1 Tax=Flavobacterium chilense TaxID=946677 RepID=A0A1M7DZ62_9FLAO|nr:DUF4296 domain-containing protein [Flavobacterium chilense]SHL84784.1 protein of unknown function [Flavobacterium chilense]